GSQKGDNKMMLKRTSVAIVLAILILGVSAVLSYAQNAGLIGAGPARRTMQVLIGLSLAAYANLMPKEIGAWRASTAAMARAQSVRRVGGWSMTLAGLTYAALWAFAPLDVANIASVAVVAVAMLITLGYGGWSIFACRPSR